MTLRGRGNRTNRDAATTATRPDGTRMVIVADGLSNTHHSEVAAHTVVSAALAELRADRPNRTPEKTVRDAYQAAAQELTAAHRAAHPGDHLADPNPYATTVVIALVTPDGQVVLGWVGDSRAYLVPAAGGAPARQLTTDHTDGSTTSIMTRWLAPDYHPTLSPHIEPAAGPALLVLTTDGLHDHLDPAAALPTPALRADPPTAARRLATEAYEAGGTDDTTAATVPAAPTRRITAPSPNPSPTAPTAPGSASANPPRW